MHLVKVLTIALVGAALAAPASAQMFASDDKMRIIVPFTAGGAVDQIARVIANNIPDAAAIVDNRGGAGGDIGVTAAAKAPPDGKTVLLHTSSHVINPTLRGSAREAAQAFEPIARIGAVKFVLVVRRDLPARSLSEMIAFGKSGGKLSYGSTGPGTALNIAGEMLNNAAGIAAVHIPYRGLNPAFTDLIAGNIDFMVTSVAGVLPHVQAGRIRALATFDAERAEQLPEIQTTVELGFKDLTISNWYGLFVAAAVPAEKRQQLEEMFLKVLRSQVVQDHLTASGVYGVQPAEEFKQAVTAEFALWPVLLRQLGIRLE
jgi:tripartite-type tricarboxylate transporter receptor subunit TctC